MQENYKDTFKQSYPLKDAGWEKKSINHTKPKATI